MISVDKIQDSQLGVIQLRPNARVVRFTFRVRDGQLVATVPRRATLRDLQRAIEELRPRLTDMLARQQSRAPQQHLITPDFRIQAPRYRFWLQPYDGNSVRIQDSAEGLVCRYAADTDFTSPDLQVWLLRQVEASMRRHATATLLPRLHELAAQRGLTVHDASIHLTHGRWGSCTAQGKINLSLYLILLPLHLQDYIMHHELTHLVEMNHGPRFYQLLDQAVGGQSEALRREVKHYDTSIFQTHR